MNTHHAANAAATFSIPAWLLSWAVDTLPVIQWFAGFTAIVAALFATYVKWHEWRKGK